MLSASNNTARTHAAEKDPEVPKVSQGGEEEECIWQATLWWPTDEEEALRPVPLAGQGALNTGWSTAAPGERY